MEPRRSPEIAEWVNERVANYQRLAGVEFLSELPRNALGKVLKKELRAPYWSEPGLVTSGAHTGGEERSTPLQQR